MDAADDKSEEIEIILLDAELVEMIHNAAFRAILHNGHALVAYIPRESREYLVGKINVGDTVKVKMSPFDMSRGEVVLA